MTATMPDFKTAKSEAVFGEAKDLMPGGVSSPVRAFKSVGGEPVVFDRVKGSKAWDVDGNEYVDYVGTWGPAICGHANDEVNEELKKALEKGAASGARSRLGRGGGRAVTSSRLRVCPAQARASARRR